MAASTARTWLRSDSDSVHSQKRVQASRARKLRTAMAGTLAQLPGGGPPSARARALPPLMEKFVIEGGVPLSGTIVPAGNKNAALPLLAACLLTEDEVVLHNVPRIRDTEAMLDLLADLGVKVERRGRQQRSRLQADDVRSTDVDAELAERIRASVPRRRPAAGALRLRADAAARRRRDRPPPAGPAPRRVPRARRRRRARRATSA